MKLSLKYSPRILISIGIGLVVALLVAKLLGLGSTANSGPPVVIATEIIEPGLVLPENKLRVISWGGGAAPTGSFDTIKGLKERVARQKIYPGELILESKLAGDGSSAGLSAMIEPGRRAITVRVNDVIGVAGFTLPGSYVDVLVSIKKGSDDSFSKIVLERVRVLAIAQQTEADNTKPKVVNAVTLELTPAESEKLDLARTVGTLSLILRNELDVDTAESQGVRMSDLTQKQMSSGFSSPKNKSNVVSSPSYSGNVEIIRGSKRVEVEE